MINPPECKAFGRAWTKSEIRAARKTPLAPLLQDQGLTLKPLSGGNFLVVEHGDLVLKTSYWRWPSRGMDGNAIDYFMLVQGRTFNQAMQVLSAPESNPGKRSALPSYASAPEPQQTHTMHL